MMRHGANGQREHNSRAAQPRQPSTAKVKDQRSNIDVCRLSDYFWRDIIITMIAHDNEKISYIMRIINVR